MERRIISTAGAPQAMGPYSQGIRSGEFIFCAGQIPLDPATGRIVEGDIRAQTRRVLENLSAVLTEAGSSLSRIVKTTVFLANLDDFKAMNETYAEFFTSAPPARSTAQVARLPAGALLEIEAIAVAN
jgi:2-iminobutanoate/2-iminopropanoate deaminase